MRIINLDHNATTPLAAEGAQAMAECWAAGLGNPASQHALGRRARQTLEDARERIGELLGAKMTGREPDRVIFTSGGTEANNLALRGMISAAAGEPSDTANNIIVSAIEHPSVLGPAEYLGRSGWGVHRLPVSPSGVVNLEALGESIGARTRLASLMLGNNETGVLQPLSAASELCAAHGVPLHCDAAQVAGKLPVDFRALNVAAMTVAAHKFHGPVGIGALVVRHGVVIEPQLFGGFQQAAARPGTESVVLAVGMRAALEAWRRESEERATRMEQLRDYFEALVLAGYPALVINGQHAARLPHTSNLAFVGLDRQQLSMALDLAGVACSTGSACASGSSEPSTVLLAMGCPPDVVGSSLRFSLGAETTAEEIEEAAKRVLEVCGRLSSSSRTAATLPSTR